MGNVMFPQVSVILFMGWGECHPIMKLGLSGCLGPCSFLGMPSRAGGGGVHPRGSIRGDIPSREGGWRVNGWNLPTWNDNYWQPLKRAIHILFECMLVIACLRSCGNLMYLSLGVSIPGGSLSKGSLSGGGGSLWVSVTEAVRYGSRRYKSYWNVFLLD